MADIIAGSGLPDIKAVTCKRCKVNRWIQHGATDAKSATYNMAVEARKLGWSIRDDCFDAYCPDCKERKIVEKLACNTCDYFRKEKIADYHYCERTRYNWISGVAEIKDRCVRHNNDGKCPDHSDRGYKCHWCGVAVAEYECGFYDYRYEANTWTTCPDCLKKHHALLDSLKHWEDNLGGFRGKRKLQKDKEWFKAFCQGDDCACCVEFMRPNIGMLVFLGASASCGTCPLMEGKKCCNGLWKKAKDAADGGHLTLSHLTAVRDYIRGICEKEGIIAPKEKPYDVFCNWCEKGYPETATRYTDYRIGDRLGRYNQYKCPTCQTTHDALKKSLDHWIDNCRNIDYRGLGHKGQTAWFKAYCGGYKCACCNVFYGRIKCCGCPLINDESGCCNGSYHIARTMATSGLLSPNHLQKIRDYIYLICVREGIVERPPQITTLSGIRGSTCPDCLTPVVGIWGCPNIFCPAKFPVKKPIMERLQHTLDEARKVYGDQDYTFVVGKNVLIEISRARGHEEYPIRGDGSLKIHNCPILAHKDDPDEIRITWGDKKSVTEQMEKITPLMKRKLGELGPVVFWLGTNAYSSYYNEIGKLESNEKNAGPPFYNGFLVTRQERVDPDCVTWDNHHEKPKGVCLSRCEHFLKKWIGAWEDGDDVTEDWCKKNDLAQEVDELCPHNLGYHVTPVSDE